MANPDRLVVLLFAACGDGNTMIDAAPPLIDAPSDAAIDAAPDAPPDARTTATLMVTRAGTGTGSIAGALACGASCTTATVTLPLGAAVTLDAQVTNATGSWFAGWSGACTGFAPRCTFTLTADASATATFSPQPANLAFVTSARYAANLGGLAQYDQICNDHASAVGINVATNRGYVAWLSSSTASAPSRLGSARGWVRMDGRAFADEVSDLVAGQLFHPVTLDERAADRVKDVIWTGTHSLGGPSVTCTDWTATTSTAMGGVAGGGPDAWTANTFPDCSGMQRLLCLGTTQVEPVAPAPLTGKRIWLTTQPYLVGVTTPDAHCMANKPAGVTATHAVIATTTSSAASKLVATTRYIRPDGSEVGTGATIAALGTLTSGWWEDSSGAYGREFYWCGALSPGALGTSTCGDWTTTAGSTPGGVISTVTINQEWGDFLPTCNAATYKLLCVED